MEVIQKMMVLASVRGYTAIAVGIIIGLGALGARIGVGVMCSKFLESAACQPNRIPQLQRVKCSCCSARSTRRSLSVSGIAMFPRPTTRC